MRGIEIGPASYPGPLSLHPGKILAIISLNYHGNTPVSLAFDASKPMVSANQAWSNRPLVVKYVTGPDLESCSFNADQNAAMKSMKKR